MCKTTRKANYSYLIRSQPRAWTLPPRADNTSLNHMSRPILASFPHSPLPSFPPSLLSSFPPPPSLSSSSSCRPSTALGRSVVRTHARTHARTHRAAVNQKRKDVRWREIRPYMLAHEVDFAPSATQEADGQPVGTMAIRAYVRGKDLDVNRLVYLPGGH